MGNIQKLIRSLGIGGTYRGYRYLVSAISLRMKDEDYLLGISKLLYPQIARAYDTSVSSVERDLRTVINVCWERGNRQLLEEISLYPLMNRPTTGEFLDILMHHLKQNTLV